MYKILVVENNFNVSSKFKKHLEKEACEVVIVNKFEKVMEYFYMMKPNMVILASKLPVFDGFYWLRKIRPTFTCPIIFIFDRVNEKEQIRALDEGADDCIAPPFLYKVIVAKIKRNLHRTYGEYVLNPAERFIEIKGLKYYPERLQIQFKTKRVTLTNNERSITEVIFSQYPRTVTHEELLSVIRKSGESVSKNTLYKNIVRVNKKIESIGIKKAIKVVSKKGYRLNIREGPRANTSG